MLVGLEDMARAFTKIFYDYANQRTRIDVHVCSAVS